MSSADPNHEATDEALFALAAQREERPTAARAAEAELYRRHVRYLYGVVKRREAALSRLCGVSPEDLVQETFQRAFSYASSYSGGGVVDPEQARRRARAW